MDYAALIQRFKKIRESQGLDQADVARRVGVSGGLISHREKGRRQAGLDDPHEWAEALGCELRVELHERRPRAQDRMAELIRELPGSDVEFVKMLVAALPGLGHTERRRLKALLAAYSPDLLERRAK